ncbi:lipase [Streptomyces sp. NPDC060194]|uniref:lipase n=1 Tax=Streptomyces sp. NPDC060194 TaxID=3347069 RepID=UPI003667B282
MTVRVTFPDARVRVEGAQDLDVTPRGARPRRLPAWTRPQITDPFFELAVQAPAGVRLALRTEATALALRVRTTRVDEPGRGPLPAAFDLVVDGRLHTRTPVTGGDLMRRTGRDGVEPVPGEAGTYRFGGLPAGEKELRLWLPQSAVCDLVELSADAPVAPPLESDRPRWVHYGSSVSQCVEAAGPTGTWPAVAATAAGLDLTCLGFSGNAMLDPCVARTIRDLPADLITLKIGINVVDGATMRLRTFLPAVHGFLDTVREGHLDTPLVVLSPIACPALEDTPGPGAVDPATGRVRATGDPGEVPLGALTLGVVREELARLVAARAGSDPALTYLDGRELLGPDDTAGLPDGLHPDGDAYRRMGERFAALLGAGRMGARGMSPSQGGV